MTSVSGNLEHLAPASLVLAGGVGLGAYHGGVYEGLCHRVQPEHIAGSSIGAVTAALIAGVAKGTACDNLRAFWRADFGQRQPKGNWSHLQNWVSALGARVMGVPGHFRPRLSLPADRFISLYDLSPMRERIAKLVDFGRLNNGDIRISVATTDIETGEMVLFDTAKGDRIGVDHLLASCGYLPEFAPLEIEGRLLGDGGLSGNAPLEAVLGDAAQPRVCLVADLYARDGCRPTSLEEAFARRSDLTFANQTWQRLQTYQRQMMLRAEAGESSRGARILYLSYRAATQEAGPEKIFDYSPRSVSQRWQSGRDDAALALLHMDTVSEGATITAIRHPTRI